MQFGWDREPSAEAKTDFPLGKLHIREVVTWKNTLGRLPLRENPLGKYLISCSVLKGTFLTPHTTFIFLF